MDRTLVAADCHPLAALVEGKAVDAGLIGPAPQFLKLLTIAGVKDADEGPLV